MPIQKVSKDEIINRSYDLFRQNGFHHTSMSDIAKACGVFKSSLYHYFPSKDELLKEVLRKINDYNKSNQYNILLESERLAVEVLSDYLDKVESMMFRSEGGCFLGNMALETSNPQSTFKDELISSFDEWKNALATLFRRRHDEVTAEEMAYRAISDIEGGVMLSRVYNDKSYFHKAKNRVLKYVQ